MNNHIEKYLESYLELDKPEFAVLLTGKWGSGKTYFIDKFIEHNTKEEEIKFIKISLFGLKEVDSIDEQIFQNLHPFLGNKYVKLTGNLVKNSLKFGMKLDWKDDAKPDGTSTLDLSKLNLLDFFSDKKSKIKIIFVFDDLERTDIELIEVLGYINYLIEQSEFNVIILANEEKLIEEEVKSESTKYIEFKEKVIGKTFEVQHDFDQILISLISENTDKSKKYLNENKAIIKDIYSKAEHHNLRHIKQIVLDFEYFIKEVDEKYLDNKEFISVLINNFFALSIELKSGSLEEKELSDKPNLMFDKDKEKSNVAKIYEKYNIEDMPLFNGQDWVRILLKSSVSKEVINDVFSKLSFFIEEKKNERVSWVKLWYYRELENDDFEKVLNDVLDKFKNCKYKEPEYFLHIIALLIYFSKKGLCDLNLGEIEKQITICIEKYKETSTWKEKSFEDRWNFNSTGLGYMDSDSEEFRKFYYLIKDENEKIYDANQKVIEKNKLEELLTAIKKNDEKLIEELLLNTYKEKPLLQNLSIEDFFPFLKNINNKSLMNFTYILNARYPDNHGIYNQKIYCYYLKEELKFWKKVDKELKVYIEQNENKTLSSFLLKEFHKFTIKNLVKKLEDCTKNA